MVKDLSHLPTADPVEADEVIPILPLTDPQIGPLIVNNWFEQRDHDDHLPHAIPDAGLYRGSYAGSCSRQIWYKMTDTEPSDPSTVADHWRMGIGTMVHEELQAAISTAMPNAEHEVAIDLNPIGIAGSMRLDTIRTVLPGVFESMEIKSINGFGYKASATKFKKTGPEGPRESAVIQAALGAVALQEDRPTSRVEGARIVYLAIELVSPKLAQSIGDGSEVSRFCAEWFIPLDQCIAIVAREVDRINRMVKQGSTGEWVIPVIPTNPLGTPGKLKIVNPKSGAAVDTEGNGASTWQCNYCDFQQTCIKDHDNREEEA